MPLASIRSSRSRSHGVMWPRHCSITKHVNKSPSTGRRRWLWTSMDESVQFWPTQTNPTVFSLCMLDCMIVIARPSIIVGLVKRYCPIALSQAPSAAAHGQLGVLGVTDVAERISGSRGDVESGGRTPELSFSVNF
jgi:hypothetical protein